MKKLPFYYSLTIIDFDSLYFQSKKKMNKHPKIIHIYFKKLQENGPELDHEKNNKLQNNLLCLKSFMYLHGELKYSLSHTDTYLFG